MNVNSDWIASLTTCNFITVIIQYCLITQFLQPPLSRHPLLSRHLGRSRRCPLIRGFTVVCIPQCTFFFSNMFVFYCQHICCALTVENVCSETLRQVTTDWMSIKNHMLAEQNCSSRQSPCVVTAKLHVHCSMKVGLAATGRVKTCTQILELNLARLISLLFLFIRNYCSMCWLSSTSNDYFFIVCSIKRWKSQCGKMQTMNLSCVPCKQSIKMSQIRKNSKHVIFIMLIW